MAKTTRPLAHIQDTPREALNWRLWFAIAVIGLLGLSRGGDEGTVGNMTESAAWRREFNVESGSADQVSIISTCFKEAQSLIVIFVQQSNVVSQFQLGNLAGSLLAFFLVDNLGRLRTIQACCLIWILGTAVWITANGSLGQTLAGRFVAGLGVGGFVSCYYAINSLFCAHVGIDSPCAARLSSLRLLLVPSG